MTQRLVGDRVHIVIVGYGRAGRQHAEAIEQATGVTLHSVLESDQNVDVGSRRRALNWEDVLSDPDVDGVALCLPPGGRADLAIAALNAGKSVLLEKPPCMSVAELNRVGAHPGRISVMLQHRFRLSTAALETSFKDSVGTLLVSRPRDALAHYTGWRGDTKRALGGIAAHLGIHYLDLACQLLGEVSQVDICDYRECAPGIDVRVSGFIRFGSGASLGFTVAADVPARTEQLVILGDDRRFEICDGAVTLRLGDRIERHAAAPTGAMRTRVYEEFARGPDLCALDRARPVLTVLDEVRKAGAR